MKKYGVFLFTLLFLAGVFPPLIVKAVTGITDDLLTAVVMIEATRAPTAEGSDLSYARGSGTVVTPDNLILTNAHVVYDPTLKRVSEEITLSYTLNSQYPPVCLAQGNVLSYDLDLDLALVEPISALNDQCQPMGPFTGFPQGMTYIGFRQQGFSSPILPKIGENLTVVGYPAIAGNTVTVTDGIVSGYLFHELDPTAIASIKTNADIDPGNSGGAALDDGGNFVGVPSFGAFDVERGAKLNGVIPLNIVLAWFDELADEGLLKSEQPSVELKCFSDISAQHPQAEAICSLKATGILVGYQDGTFRPDQVLNRAELMKILIEGISLRPEPEQYSSCFTDIHREWFAPAICYSKVSGIVSGYDDGSFRPGQPVNKVEALKMLLNTHQLTLPSSYAGTTFIDVKPEDWFSLFVQKAQEMNLLIEKGRRFLPGEQMTRAKMSEMLYRLLVIEKNALEKFPE